MDKPAKKSVSDMRFTALLILVGLLAGAYYVSHRTKASNACWQNLSFIQGSKETWGAEHPNDTNRAPSWNELLPYLGKIPHCPNGGIYNVGRIDQMPTCSISGPDHTYR